MTVDEAVQNMRIKLAAFRAAERLRERRAKDWWQCKEIMDNAAQTLNIASADEKDAAASYHLAKEALIKTIEEEIVCPKPSLATH